MLQQSRVKKVEGKEEQERRYRQVWLSMKKYLGTNSSQVYCSDAAI